MKKVIKLFKLLVLILGIPRLFATTPSLVVKTQVNGQSVALRWTPNNYNTWQLWQTNGYQIERQTVQTESTDEKNFRTITKRIMPYTKEQLAALSDQHPNLTLVSACLGLNKSPQNSTELIQQIDRDEQCYIYSMLALQNDYELTIAFGLGTIDSSVAPNAIYLYKLYPIGGSAADTQYCLVNTALPSFQPNIHSFNTSIGHNLIYLAWPAQLYQNHYYAYQIERSLDSGLSYQSLSNLPILPSSSDSNLLLPTVYSDTIAAYQQWLIYRIRGINYFGQLSLPFSQDTLIALYETSAYPSSVNITYPQSNQIHLNWAFDSLEESNIKGFKLSICDSSEGSYSTIDSIFIKASERSFDFSTQKTTFYLRVNAITLNNQLNPSFQTLAQQVDSLPPDAPYVSHYEVDSAGHIEIHWHQPKANDCMAFRIYRSNSRFNEFSVATPHYLNDPIFRDTLDLNMLRDSIYYKVSSVDQRYNESNASHPIALSLPNNIPPATPLIYAIENSVHSIQIKWHPSNSSGVIQYRLSVFDHSSQNEIEKTLNLTDTTYSDSTLKAGKTYSFTLYAKKTNGLWSTSAQPITIKRPINPWMPAIESVFSSLDSAQNRIDLFWQYKYDQEVKHYRIIAYDADGHAHSIGNTAGGTTYFSYPYLKPNTMKKYTVIAYFKDGRRSQL